MDDEELGRRFDGLMERINNNHEQMLERFRSIDHQFTSVGATLKTMSMTMELIVSLLGDFAKRITDLEKK